jgi:DNA-directed RNA polymerase specialized sigma24 family protein
VSDNRPDVQTLLVTRGANLQRVAYLLTGDWILAEDLLGATLSRAVARWGRLGYDDPFLGVLHELVQTWSVWWRRRWAPMDDSSALSRLSRRQRATAVMVLHVKLPEVLVATLLDVSVTAVLDLLEAVTEDPAAVAALAELAEDEPPPPPRDRLGAAQREVSRRRRRVVAVVGVVVVAATAGIVATRGGSGHHPARRAAGSRPSWVLPWPDQRAHGPDRQLLQGAVGAWASRGGVTGLVAPPATWFVGQPVAHGHDVVVIFEVDGVRGHRLVAGWAPTQAASRYYNGVDSPDPWTLYDVPAPLVSGGIEGGSARAPVISFYIPQRRGTSVVTDRVVALTAPVARSIAIDSPAGSLVARLHQGFGTVNLPAPVTGPATILASGTPDQELIGVPGDPASDQPALSVPAMPTLPRKHFRLIGRLADVGRSNNDLGPNGLPGGHIEVAVRCRGSSDLTVSIGVVLHAIGTAVCDGRTHLLLDAKSVASAAPQSLVVNTGSLTSYQLAVGVRP